MEEFYDLLEILLRPARIAKPSSHSTLRNEEFYHAYVGNKHGFAEPPGGAPVREALKKLKRLLAALAMLTHFIRLKCYGG